MPDALWAEIASLFPPEVPRPKDGRLPVGSREALTGILFVLYTAIGWGRLPFEGAGCSGMTYRRRLRAWQDIGLWTGSAATCSTAGTLHSLVRPRNDRSRLLGSTSAMELNGGRTADIRLLILSRRIG